MRNVHPQSAVIASCSPSENLPSAEGQRCNTVAVLPHRRAYVLTAWRSAHAWIEAAYPSGLDAARAELAAAFPELAQNCDRLERAAQQAANLYENEPAASPDAFTSALRAWERAVLDGLAALDSARSGELCIDCGAEVATVKTGLGQRVCARCLREGVTP
ncbi:MAG: hypothetical protein WCG85_18260 [Polyangia bacterium]